MSRPSNPDREHAHGQGSFFGRRKGHKLRAAQADLIETLLPRLALDITTPAPADLRDIFDRPLNDVRLDSAAASI
jgi:tRNA (guanine-N7-)-methyltransferase